jgi:hypothetical protein
MKFYTTVANVYPEWVTTNPGWKLASKFSDTGNAISDILKVPASKRTQEQVRISVLIFGCFFFFVIFSFFYHCKDINANALAHVSMEDRQLHGI